MSEEASTKSVAARDYKPKIGPYATLKFDPEEDRWKAVLTDAGREICRAYLEKYPGLAGIAKLQCRRQYAYVRYITTFDERQSLYMLAVAKAVTRYDPARGSLVTVVASSIWGVLQGHIRAHVRQQRRATITSLDDADWKEPPAPEHVKPDDDDVALAAGLMSRLEPRTRAIFAARFGFDGQLPLTLSQIADEQQISKQRVDQIIQATMTDMRAHTPEGRIELRNCIHRLLHRSPQRMFKLVAHTGVCADVVETALTSMIDEGVVAEYAVGGVHQRIWHLTDREVDLSRNRYVKQKAENREESTR